MECPGRPEELYLEAVVNWPGAEEQIVVLYRIVYGFIC